MTDWADNMQQAYQVGDSQGVFKAVQALRAKQEKPPRNLNTDADGNLLDSAEAVAKVWGDFLQNKFAATQAELKRPAME